MIDATDIRWTWPDRYADLGPADIATLVLIACEALQLVRTLTADLARERDQHRALRVHLLRDAREAR